MCANAQSVTKKIDELDAECQRKSIDISATTEIWLNDDIHSICQDQCDAFTSVLNSLIEEHFPATTEVRHSNDKPWVTEGFKALV